MDRVDLTTLRREVEAARAHGTDQDAKQLIRWAHSLLGSQLMMSTAFGYSGMVILHMVRDLCPDLPVYFLDTGFHFPESLQFAEDLRAKWKVNLILKRPKVFGEAFREKFGEALYQRNPDLCCHKNKVEPFDDLLNQHQGWITGIRRDQGSTRAQAEPLEVLEGARLKVQPLVHWRRADVEAYLKEHDVPLHPLFSQGYTSVGCAPCTRPATDSNDERSGRWAGLAKRECGLHTSWKAKEPKTESDAQPEAPNDDSGSTKNHSSAAEVDDKRPAAEDGGPDLPRAAEA